MHRPTIGAIAILLFAAAPIFHFAGWGEPHEWTGAFWKVAAVMAALWLAHPELVKVPRKVLIAFIIGFFALAIFIVKQPRAIALLAAIAIFLAWFRPRIDRTASKR